MKYSSIIHTPVISALFASCLMMPLISSAADAPGAIADSPLFTATNDKHNIMFMVDDSGSMNSIVPEAPDYIEANLYDPDTVLPVVGPITCPSPVASGASIQLSVFGPSDPRINIGGDVRLLGSAVGTRYCFDPVVTYTNVKLHTLGGLQAFYKGNYLNWYFNADNIGGSWTAGNRKPGTKSRLDISKTALTGLLGSLTDTIRAGLVTFNDNNGGHFDSYIEDLTTANLPSFISDINTIAGGGNTPLAETLLDIGRYFANDNDGVGLCGGGEVLKLHPGEANETDETCTAVLNTTRAVRSKPGPIQNWCQKSFAILLTDGQPKEDDNELRNNTYLRDYDGDCSSAAQVAGAYTCGSNPLTNGDRKSNVSYIGGSSDYWDDVAQALFEIDLRPDHDDNNNDEVLNNITTYTIGFADEQVQTHPLIDETGDQGGGRFIFADDSTGLENAFSSITNDILAATSTAAAVTFNTSTLGTNDAGYLARFNTNTWSGNLLSVPITSDGNVDPACEHNPNPGPLSPPSLNCWRAADQLDAQVNFGDEVTFDDTRFMLTYNPASKTAIPFKKHANYTTAISSDAFSAELINDLCAHAAPGGVALANCDATPDAAATTYISKLIDYFRGHRIDENNLASPQFRPRDHVLGDIVHANPVYVAAPALNWPDADPFGTSAAGHRYSAFKASSIKDRKPVVYVAANDGMLHGFRTLDDPGANPVFYGGQEVLAYIPSYIMSSSNNEGLHYLAETDYDHKYYVDLSPTVSDVYIPGRDNTGAATAAAWRTVLVGGSAAGGRGLFALDITNPGDNTPAGTGDFNETEAKKLVLWEFNDSDDSDLGLSFSKPTIVMTHEDRWAAIFGNGYNSGGCSAQLFIVFMDADPSDGWDEGTSNDDYLKIDTEVGTPGDCNGLSTPALVDLDKDGIVDRVYAGDLKGNMWAFDLTGNDNSWKVAYSNGAIPAPLFSAGVTKPITSKPIISINSEVTTAVANEPNLLVLFGTGQYLNSGDTKTINKIQSFYGVWDQGEHDLTPSELVAQTLTTADCDIGVGRCRTVSDNSIPWGDDFPGGERSGWYMNLSASAPDTSPVDGVPDGPSDERVIVSPKIRNSILFFNTLIPENDISCGFGGSGWLMSVDVATGGPPLDSVFDANRDGVIDTFDKIGGDVAVGEKITGGLPAESTFLGDNQYTPDSSGKINIRKISGGDGTNNGRLSWQELRQQ